MDMAIAAALAGLGLGELPAEVISAALLLAGLLLAALLVNLITGKIITAVLSRIIEKTATKWDDILMGTGLFNRMARIVPGLLLYFSFPLFFRKASGMSTFLQRLILAYLILVILNIFNAFLTGVNRIYSTYDMSRNRPIKGYLQIVRVIAAIMAVILAASVLMDRSALGLLSGIGALSAVLMLVFKDSILGLVAAVQLTGNDMIRIGDWISVPDHDADGDVVDIKLQTVTVQNWDKTLVSVPIYSLVSSSFKNWRGMSESGGRRIKRHISLDMNSVKFCTGEMLDKFREIDLLKDFIPRKQEEIDEDNRRKGVNTVREINGRRMTNLGVFRAYLAAYLRNNPLIHGEMTFLVRQLQPTDKGIPLEVYVFSRDQAWASYENIQADIFDHILAAVPFFELAVFQSPSSLDFRRSFPG